MAGEGDPRSLCLEVLGRWGEKREKGPLTVAFNGESLLLSGMVSSDVAEVTTMTCKDDSFVSVTKIAGVLTRARLLGDKAYAALLEAVLKSRPTGPGMSTFLVSDDALTLGIVYPYCEALRAVEEARRKGKEDASLAEFMETLVDFAMLVKAIAVSWAVEALEKLERGEKPSPLDVDTVIEELRRGEGRSRPPTMDPESLIL